MPVRDLTNQTFNNLKVIRRAEDFVSKSGKHEVMWECECLLCGDHIVTRGRNLTTGHIKSCGKKHRRVEDLTGRTFGELKVLERAGSTKSSSGSNYTMWLCECSCGRTVVVRSSSLKNGHTSSCGICSRSKSNMGHGLIDITGQTFGYWKVLGLSRSMVQSNGRRVYLWKCRCKCGEIRELRAGTLKQKLSLSCGCYKAEVLQQKKACLSNAEKSLSNFLMKNDIYFETQKTYPRLRGESGYPLSYDFLIYKDAKPFLLVECQGKQHYEPVEYFGGERQFVIQQKNDEYKRRFAKRVKLPLLEIPYWWSDSEMFDVIKKCLDC